MQWFKTLGYRSYFDIEICTFFLTSMLDALHIHVTYFGIQHKLRVCFGRFAFSESLKTVQSTIQFDCFTFISPE